MFLFITLAVLAILAVSFILLFRKKNNQKNEEITNKEKVKNLNSWISSYFSDYKLLKEDYISYQRKENFREKWSFLLEELQSIKIKKSDQLFHLYLQFYDNYSKLDSEIAEANKVFIREQNTKYDSLFSNIDGKSLDLQQREVVISEENNTLVLAGAGSGKTLTIAAKVKFLCEVKKILPNEILLISFTNKSADEMTERIHKKMGIPLEATTFHKLGLDIIKKSYGYRPDVFDELNNFVHNYFENEIINHPDLVRNLTEYFTYYLEIPIDLNNCSSLGEAYELEKASDLETLKSKYEREKYINKICNENSKSHTTLKGEHVKSLEETKIANFLFMHGINYEYERLYPYESEDLLKKAYRPDFYLTDYDIYLEHFGINRNYQCPWLSAIEEKKYVEGIKWKREFHRKNGTKLIETYSYNMSEGNLFKVLEQLLIENGVEFKDRDFIDIFNIIYAKKSDKYFSEFIKLCCSFITLFKSEN